MLFMILFGFIAQSGNSFWFPNVYIYSFFKEKKNETINKYKNMFNIFITAAR